MKVILTKDVQNLGSAGDIKDVADGYARNFLIPGGYVTLVTKDIIKQSEEVKQKNKKLVEEGLKTAEELSKKMEGMVIVVKAKADKSGKLYAAIKEEEILKVIIDKGFKGIDKSKIIFKEPIKEIGEHKVVINLNHGLESRLNIIVENNK
ncbi:MAG: 50S ribosomal protein L9 [Patescibacteria group bacterium]|nr:50S ribosomal protein L9 [Patescibacteria group bacterium]